MAEEQKQIDSKWQVQKSLNIISRRFDFSDYDQTRTFLDQLSELSESESYYPDLTFSRTHVNVAIKARDESLAQADYDLSEKIDVLATAVAGQNLDGQTNG